MTRRGRPPRLSRPAIVAAAQAVVERDGVEALTMRRVAEELGASPMALYRHVRGKDELLVLLLDELAAALARPDMPAEPRERVLGQRRHRPGAHIGGGTHLERNAALCQVIEQPGVTDRGDPVADTFGAEVGQRVPHRLWPGRLAGS